MLQLMATSTCSSWAPLVSDTAVKYQKYGYVEKKPFLPGEKRTADRETDKRIKGMKELRFELEKCRKTLQHQKRQRMCAVEKSVQASFYKSPVGTRTVKMSGNVFLI